MSSLPIPGGPFATAVLRTGSPTATWAEAATSDGSGTTVCVRGAAWSDGRSLAEADLAARVAEVAEAAPEERRREAMLDLCRRLNGAWAFVVRWPDGEAVAAVDRLRLIPLFFGHLGDGRLAIASDTADLADCSRAGTLDDEAAVEFLLSGYIMDSRTLDSGVSQLQPGEVLHWRHGTVSRHRYFRFLRGAASAEGPESLTQRLHETMDEVFARLAERFAGQRIIVPLSGGLDSRLVVAMLKRHGHRDLVALNYGRPGSRDAETSHAVADALDIPWEFVAYEDGDWWPLMTAPAMRAFWHHAGQAAALPHLQDYLALHRLRQRDPGLEAVFFPGYVGDMIAGAWTPCSALFHLLGTPPPPHFSEDDGPADLRAVRGLLLHIQYRQWPASRDEIANIERRMGAFFAGAPISEANDSASAFDLFEFENRQARYLANAVRSFEFHGFGWWLPLCDSELMDFFLTVPRALRKTKRLYAGWMRERIFIGQFSRLAEIPPLGDGYVAWYGEPRTGRRRALTQGARARLPAIRAVEPRWVRDVRLRRALRTFRAPDLRFHEWFAADDVEARSATLASVLASADGPLAGLPDGVVDRLSGHRDYPLVFISPLALLAAACLADVCHSHRGRRS